MRKRAMSCAQSHSLIPEESLYEREKAGSAPVGIVDDSRDIRANGATD
ncbi:hypothetical protein [Synechococcus sp. PCC 7335]|nr:hypothetical protein [Synechococcus sp. PCC 7335]